METAGVAGLAATVFIVFPEDDTITLTEPRGGTFLLAPGTNTPIFPNIIFLNVSLLAIHGRGTS